jgi:transposase
MFAEWRLRRDGIDYHVDVDHHFYSVPHSFARAEVEVRLTARTVEIFARGERIAAHVRSSGNHGHSTIREHMPSSHRRYADWTIDRIRQEAAGIGPATAALCELILDRDRRGTRYTGWPFIGPCPHLARLGSAERRLAGPLTEVDLPC